ncbi:MAG: ribonuclease [Crocinitomicaceae bacterium]|jgi:ribonuclease HII|nr:ribonuclease [Crocinitomicaceae bacterium]
MSGLLPYFNEKLREAGCDEAGRGCMAGPVVAASVLLPPGFSHELLDDSKKMTEKSRNILREIIEKEALSWDVQFISPEKIDEINILNASILGMQQAALKLSTRPEFVIIDGNRFHSFEIPHKCFVQGDGKYRSIAAASVLAKTHRDELMEKLHHEFPEYNWKQNKGYPTLDHRKAIIRHGLSKYHRKTFQLKNVNQLELSFEL